MTIAFGPVPSRRLGRSLGINNIPPKSCSYSCLYCQVGTTLGKTVVPQVFYQPEAIREAVESQLQKVCAINESVDYLTFVPDGEPGLDINLGKSIELLRPLGIPIAIISNASLLWREEVRSAMSKADWVSVKVDSVEETIWKRLNRPHETLQLSDILDGIRRFIQEFAGELVTETMLIEGVNDNQDNVSKTADFLHELSIAKAYLAIPTRPPAEPTVHGPAEPAVNSAYQLLASRVPQVEYLIGYEGDAFAFTGDIHHDLLSITAVHPMRESAVRSLLEKAQTEWQVVDQLVAEGKLAEAEYQGERFYLRCFSK
jgi:wyosine [tRNA(Phe)-imidazoG37] synthetase (radical SAM superfamily)